MTTISTIMVQPLISLTMLVVPVFLLGASIAKLSGRLQNTLVRLIGVQYYLLFFGWLGTAVHELSHAAMCLIFGHKINKIKMFRLFASDESGGYVYHSFDRRSLRQRLGRTFVSVAPLIGGAVVIWLAAMLLMPGFLVHIEFQPSALDNLVQLLVTVPVQTSLSMLSWQNWVDLKFYVFLYVLVSIGCSLRLSAADMKNAVKGCGVLLSVAYCALLALVLLDFGFDLQITNRLLSAVGLSYALLVAAIVSALIILGPLIGILKLWGRGS